MKRTMPAPKYHKGDILIGNINSAKIEVLGTQGTSYILRDTKTGRKLVYGISALDNCSLTLEGGE